MNIESAQYISHEGKVKTVKATIDGEEMFVPISEGNRHYAAILEWAKEDGNEIQAAE
tara:strand:- start:53 stop:223 length:171 start_codon:yes stop_codon:yes gene_type:complete